MFNSLMRTSLLTIIFVLSMCLCHVFGQQSIEAEAWNFSLAYNQAILKNDAAFMEKHLDEHFISIGPNSHILSRAEAIAQTKRPSTQNDFVVVDLKSLPVKIAASENLVVITSNWKVIRQSTAAANAPKQTDSGTTTAVYRKDVVWKILSEHVAFDRAPENAEIGAIARLGAAFNRSLVNRNYSDVEAGLAPSYLRVDSQGWSWNRSQFLSDIRSSKLTVNSIVTSGVYVNRRENTAVETGFIIMKGSREGSDFAINQQYTRLWAKVEDVWRVAAEYFIQPPR